ncbi:hypothetical protein [Mariniflexile rhizosphaerae]|nr:hypothetical protein [Mariniflexile sp. TRM1-10]PLB19199.1 MAG: hypothetical protein TRG1_1903 [Flavobacteriaceae bacterium FS1-H7996/R]
MRYKLRFLFFIPFTFLANSQPTRGLYPLFNPEAIGYKNGNWIQQHNP